MLHTVGPAPPTSPAPWLSDLAASGGGQPSFTMQPPLKNSHFQCGLHRRCPSRRLSAVSTALGGRLGIDTEQRKRRPVCKCAGGGLSDPPLLVCSGSWAPFWRKQSGGSCRGAEQLLFSGQRLSWTTGPPSHSPPLPPHRPRASLIPHPPPPQKQKKKKKKRKLLAPLGARTDGHFWRGFREVCDLLKH